MGTKRKTVNQVNFMDILQEEYELKPEEVALSKVLDGLLSVYFKRVPDAKKIVTMFHKRGDIVTNDHVAFRSISIIPLLKVFLPYGYTVQFDDNDTKTPFNFTGKKLSAVWLKHRNTLFPRIFISEIRLEELHKSIYDKKKKRTLEIQKIIEHYFSDITDPIDTLNPFDIETVLNYLHTRLWPIPSARDYQDISQESEYLSWVLYNDFYLNHFTLSVNQLDSYQMKKRIQLIIEKHRLKLKHSDHSSESDQIQYHHFLDDLKHLYKDIMTEFNMDLKNAGFTLNQFKNSDLNISSDNLLLQSSTKAAPISAQFSDTELSIPGSYVEFACRGLTPQVAIQLLESETTWDQVTANHYRDGFETQNANAIFESTYTKGIEEPEDECPISKTAFKHSKEKLIEFLDTYQMTHPNLSIF